MKYAIKTKQRKQIMIGMGIGEMAQWLRAPAALP